MQAVEFETYIDKDNIHIPTYLLPQINPRVRVILLSQETPQPKQQKRFSAPKFKTKGFKFNREELYER